MSWNSKVWVSELNARPEIRSAFPRTEVRFYDTTLRDGEQTVGVVLSPQQKLEIARKLDELGIGRIEAGFPKVSPEDAEAIQLLQKAKLKAELWGFSRGSRGDVEVLVRLGLRASVIESPTSDIKLKAYGISRDQILKRVTDAISYAKQNGITIAYFAVDGTRTELEFLRKVYLAALEAGASEIVVVDTIGACGPEAAELLVREVCRWVGPAIPVHYHGHNDFGMATACAVAAVRGGASWIQGTINGMGERAGNANLVEVALALDALYEVSTNLRLDRARAFSHQLRKVSGYELEPWKPVVGENLFRRESGAVASQFHDPPSIEPYSSELVAAERSIVLGKKSGIDSIRIKCEELGFDVPEQQQTEVLAAVKELGTRKRGLVTDEEFREMIERATRGGGG